MYDVEAESKTTLHRRERLERSHEVVVCVYLREDGTVGVHRDMLKERETCFFCN